MNDKTKLLSMLALARKAGKVVAGGDGCEKAIRDGKALLVFLASDASANTQKKFRDKTSFYDVPLAEMFTKDEISRIGLENRAVAAILDENFAKKMNQMIGTLKSDL